MKQSFLAITLCLAILFGLTACSKVSVNISDPTTSTPVNNTGISDAGNETEESTDSTTTTASNSTETTTTEAPAQNTTTKVNAPTTTKKPVVTTTKQQTPTTTAKPASQWDLPARGNEELLKQRIIYYINEYRAKEGTPKEIEYIKSILPITKLVLETAQFDVHLLKAPILANHKVRPWGYQKGPNYGFENTKAMVHNH